MSDISSKQQKFIDEYILCDNATQAAINAGYSPKTARAQGSRLLTNVDIQAALSELTAKQAMPAEEVLSRLGDMGRADMGDFLDINSMGFFEIDLNKASELKLTKLIKKVKMRTTTTVQKDGVETETHDIELELYDAQAALEKLGRYHKLFTDKTEITGKDGGAIETKLNDEQYQRTIDTLMKAVHG